MAHIVSRGTVDAITITRQWNDLSDSAKLNMGCNECENLKFAIIDWRTDANLLLNESGAMGEYWTNEIKKMIIRSLQLTGAM